MLRRLICSFTFLIVLLASAKTTIWVSRYNGPGNGLDRARSLAVDQAGNVYVTGESYGSGTDYDFATVKYSPTGHEEWVKRYNGPDNGYDGAKSVALDRAGNVYVTGVSYNPSSNFDYLTIKYDSEGNELWVRRYDGTRRSFDYARAMVVDNGGNVYVTGQSYGFGTGYDYATVKYSSNGKELWVARFNGPYNLSDEPSAIAVDNSGNVYVTGRSQVARRRILWWDYVTVKYNRTGKEQWIRRYGGPAGWSDEAKAITVDRSGNVYVTGTGWDYADYATIKYSSTGKDQWARYYRGPDARSSNAISIAVDDLGYVYVTGYTGSNTNLDYMTIKYDQNGTICWVTNYDGEEHNNDLAEDIAVDHLGSVYVTGTSHSTNTDDDYLTVKYDSDGIEEWMHRYNGSGNSWDQACAIAVDKEGDVYVTGSSYGSETDLDYVTIKYRGGECPYSIKRGKDRNAHNGRGDNYQIEITSISKTGIKIRYSIKKRESVIFLIYDCSGRLVRRLAEERKEAGTYTEVWDGRDKNGRKVTAGVYFIRLITEGTSCQEKVLLWR